MTVKVSIVTPSYNQGPYIERTILSVLNQSYQNIEYIVMDAKSKDETGSVLRKYDGQIARIVEEKDEGQADAINKGFQISSGEIMAYLNSDDCFANAEVVSNVVRHFEENPEVDVVYGKRQFIGDDGQFTRNNPFREFDENIILKDCILPQESVFWRRSIYEKAGGRVDKSFQFAMDYDLWLRFVAAGAKFKAVNEVYGLFRYYENQKTHMIWEKVGVPEIARLQLRACGVARSLDEMRGFDDEHYFLANSNTQSRSHRFADDLWQTFMSYKRACLADTFLDTW